MASASTQKTDPVMEPKLKAVDWEKVAGTGQGRVAPRARGAEERGRGATSMAGHDEGRRGPRGRHRQLMSLTWGSKLGPLWWWVPGNHMQALAAKTPEGGPPPGSLKLRRARGRGRHAQLDQCTRQSDPGASDHWQEAGTGGSHLHQAGAETSPSPLSALARRPASSPG